MTSSALLLWDVDHTLVDLGGFGRRLYETAFLRAVGKRMRTLADMTGRTERAIVIDTLALHGMVAEDGLLTKIYCALAEAAVECRDDVALVGRCLPGAAEALRSLAFGGVVQSVVTGNLRPIAIVKLGAFGLDDDLDLDIGGYGDDGIDRSLLIRKAWQRAVDKHGNIWSPARLFVIGDTPHDVIAARDLGVRAVGVASGGSSLQQLTQAGADIVLPDLTDICPLRDAVLDVLGAECSPHSTGGDE